jgi:hypothetical protein
MKTVEQWMDERKQQLIANYDAIGLRASGNWPTTLKSTVKNDGFKLKLTMSAADYSQQMIKGRGKNANQDKEAIRAWVGWAGSTFLAQWVKDKGLKMSPFAVAYEIARKGITVPNRHNTGELMKGVITNETLNELLTIVGTAVIKNLRDDLKPVGKTLVR